MRIPCVLLAGLLAAPTGWAALITTEHYASAAEAQAQLLRGPNFVGGADTASVTLTGIDPPGQAQQPYHLWESGIPRGFRIAFDGANTAAIAVDDVFATLSGLNVDSGINGLLISAFTDVAGAAVRLDHLQIQLHSGQLFPVNDVVQAQPPDYMLVRSDLPLGQGFLLAGQVTFTWSGALPDPAHQWFTAEPVVVAVPEPAALALWVLLGAAARMRRI